MIAPLRHPKRHPKHRRHRRQGGFTLIEVLVVVTVLSILCITVVVPAFTAAKRDAIEGGRKADCKTLSDAAQICRLHGGIRSGIPEDNSGWHLQSMIDSGGTGSVPERGSAGARADTLAAYNFYLDHGYIQASAVLIDGVEFISGEWMPIAWGP